VLKHIDQRYQRNASTWNLYLVKSFQTIEAVPSGPFTGPEQWLVGALKSHLALAEIRKKKAEKATATAAAVSLLALHSSPDDEEEGGVEEDPQHHDTLGNTSNDESIVRSHDTDAETSSFASEEEQLRCRTDDFCPTTFLENNSSVG